MERAFFRSREFAFALVTSLALVVVSSVVYAENLEAAFQSHRDLCEDPKLAGDPHLVDIESSENADVWTRTFESQTSNLSLARVHACVGPGEIHIRPNEAPVLRVEIAVEAPMGRAEETFEETDIQYRLTRDGEAWSLGIWQTRAPEFRMGVFRTASSHVTVSIFTPSPQVGVLEAFGTAAHLDVADLVANGAHLEAVAGSIDIRDCAFNSLKVETVAGDFDATGLAIQDAAILDATSGSIVATFASFGNATIRGAVVAGSFDLRIPLDARHGYAITASTTAGNIDFDVGSTEFSDRHDPGGGERHEVRTDGYAERPNKVKFDLETVAGDIRVRGV